MNYRMIKLTLLSRPFLPVPLAGSVCPSSKRPKLIILKSVLLQKLIKNTGVSDNVSRHFLWPTGPIYFLKRTATTIYYVDVTLIGTSVHSIICQISMSRLKFIMKCTYL